MFEKIEIEKADNGYIIYIDRGVPHIGLGQAPKVFTSERALLKELRTLLKTDGQMFHINDIKGEAKK